MSAKYSPQAARRATHRRNRILENAKCVADNFGIKYRITGLRRVLAIFSEVKGQWEPASNEANKGLTHMKLHSPYRYLPPTVYVQPAYDTRPEQPSFS
jgi:hypothetical protein